MLSEIPRIPVFPEHSTPPPTQWYPSRSAGSKKKYKTMWYPSQPASTPSTNWWRGCRPFPSPTSWTTRIVRFIITAAVFYEIVDASRFPCKLQECQLCGEEYGNKKNVATQCSFCGVWNCSSCICPRKRYHPRAKDANSEKLSICFKCDDKFLSLTLNHVSVG